MVSLLINAKLVNAQALVDGVDAQDQFAVEVEHVETTVPGSTPPAQLQKSISALAMINRTTNLSRSTHISMRV